MGAGWTRLGHHTLGSNGVLTATWSGSYRHLKVLGHFKDRNNGNAFSIRFNDDTSQAYSTRRRNEESNQSSGESVNTGTFINTGMDSYQSDWNLEMNIINPVGNYHKQMYGHLSGNKSDVGGQHFCGKWKGGDQIVKIEFELEAGNESIQSGSSMTVWGADDAPETPVYPNFPKGTIFEDSTDGKHYMWDGTSAWNEMI